MAQIISQNEIPSVLKRHQGQTIVLTNGCFDILHSGHTTYLQAAKQLGDILIVAVNSDSSITAIKGPLRPINQLMDRLQVLSALASVDYVVAFDELTPIDLIKQIKPHVHVKGGDYQREDLPEAPVVEELGGKVVILPYVLDRSTSKIIKRIIDSMQNVDLSARS